MCFLHSSSRISQLLLRISFSLVTRSCEFLESAHISLIFLAYLVVEACTGSTSELKACVVKAEEVQNPLDEYRQDLADWQTS